LLTNLAAGRYAKDGDAAQLTKDLTEHAAAVVADWWKLTDYLMLKYADGFVSGANGGYPAWWLKSVGYSKGPPPPPGSNPNRPMNLHPRD
jgi:roadblock/LC7 domain-containing protein